MRRAALVGVLIFAAEMACLAWLLGWIFSDMSSWLIACAVMVVLVTTGAVVTAASIVAGRSDDQMDIYSDAGDDDRAIPELRDNGPPGDRRERTIYEPARELIREPICEQVFQPGHRAGTLT